MPAQGVPGPPFPVLIPQPRPPLPANIPPPVHIRPQALAIECYQTTNRFLSLPLIIRQKILEHLVVSHDEVGVRIPPFDPAYLLYRGWIDDFAAIRCCCRQLSYESAEVFIKQNDFLFEDISQARFLKRCVYHWEPNWLANMRNLRLGPYFMVPPTCATTEPSEMRYYYMDFLVAMRPYWGITRLQLTLPWDFELQKWTELMSFVHGAFPNLTEFTMDRPNVQFLLPDAIGLHVHFSMPENSYNNQFWPDAINNNPLGLVFPANTSQILMQTDHDIDLLNQVFVRQGRPRLKLTPVLEAIRDLWRDSPDGSIPSPGYDFRTRRLVGGEERRRMFPQYYIDDPPPEPEQTPSPPLQPHQDISQPYHFGQR